MFCLFCQDTDYLCCNGSDNTAIFENCALNNLQNPSIFKLRTDLQPILASALEVTNSWVFSGEITSNIGLPSHGSNHIALFDVRHFLQI